MKRLNTNDGHVYRICRCTGWHIPALYHLIVRDVLWKTYKSSSPGILWSRIWSPSKKPHSFNPGATSLTQGLPYVGLTEQDVNAAHDRLARFAPYRQRFRKPAAAGSSRI